MGVTRIALDVESQGQRQLAALAPLTRCFAAASPMCGRGDKSILKLTPLGLGRAPREVLEDRVRPAKATDLPVNARFDRTVSSISDVVLLP